MAAAGRIFAGEYGARFTRPDGVLESAGLVDERTGRAMGRSMGALLLTTLFLGQPLLEGLFDGGGLNSTQGSTSAATGLEPSRIEMADWLVLVYLAADNNLDSAAVEDLEEMEQAGSTDRAPIVVQLDRAPGRGPALRLLVQHAPQAGVQTAGVPGAVQTLGEVDSGSPDTLADFVGWGRATFPARRVLLVLWNHGGGWRSLEDEFAGVSRGELTDRSALNWAPLPTNRSICDDVTSGSTLRMKQVREALAAAGSAYDIVAFDACLMGMVEVAYELKDLTSFVVASQQTIDGDGFDYAAILTAIRDRPRMAPDEVCLEILKAYDQQYGTAPDATLAIIDTGRLGGLVDAMNDFVRTLASPDRVSRDLPNRDALLEVRESAGPEIRGLPYIDLGTFLYAAGGNPKLPGSARAAGQNALQAYKSAIPGYMNTREKRRTGLSVFLPRNREYMAPQMVGTIEEYSPDNILFARDCLWPHLVRAIAANSPLPNLGPPGVSGAGAGVVAAVPQGVDEESVSVEEVEDPQQVLR